MKNFIIGLMLGVWLGPIAKEVSRQLVEKNQQKALGES